MRNGRRDNVKGILGNKKQTKQKPPPPTSTATTKNYYGLTFPITEIVLKRYILSKWINK